MVWEEILVNNKDSKSKGNHKKIYIKLVEQ